MTQKHQGWFNFNLESFVCFYTYGFTFLFDKTVEISHFSFWRLKFLGNWFSLERCLGQTPWSSGWCYIAHLIVTYHKSCTWQKYYMTWGELNWNHLLYATPIWCRRKITSVCITSIINFSGCLLLMYPLHTVKPDFDVPNINMLASYF